MGLLLTDSAKCSKFCPPSLPFQDSPSDSYMDVTLPTPIAPGVHSLIDQEVEKEFQHTNLTEDEDKDEDKELSNYVDTTTGYYIPLKVSCVQLLLSALFILTISLSLRFPTLVMIHWKPSIAAQNILPLVGNSIAQGQTLQMTHKLGCVVTTL